MERRLRNGIVFLCSTSCFNNVCFLVGVAVFVAERVPYLYSMETSLSIGLKSNCFLESLLYSLEDETLTNPLDDLGGKIMDCFPLGGMLSMVVVGMRGLSSISSSVLLLSSSSLLDVSDRIRLPYMSVCPDNKGVE